MRPHANLRKRWHKTRRSVIATRRTLIGLASGQCPLCDFKARGQRHQCARNAHMVGDHGMIYVQYLETSRVSEQVATTSNATQSEEQQEPSNVLETLPFLALKSIFDHCDVPSLCNLARVSPVIQKAVQEYSKYQPRQIWPDQWVWQQPAASASRAGCVFDAEDATECSRWSWRIRMLTKLFSCNFKLILLFQEPIKALLIKETKFRKNYQVKVYMASQSIKLSNQYHM